jgi:energy-coupling factor transport system substrate-specific component
VKLTLLSLAGIVLFLLPFTGLGTVPAAPALAIALATVVMLAAVEAGARRLDVRAFALLAALAAIDAGLRAALVVGIGGFSPFFFLVLCGGYVFGTSFGFMLGAVSLLASALITGGVGPWLPYQAFAAGWVGAAAGLAGSRRGATITGWDIAVLALVGVLTGYLFGAVMDVWDWTYFRGSPGLGWEPGLPAPQLVAGFSRFYVVTSLVYDSFRAAGNLLLVLALGTPVLAALARFRARFTLEIVDLQPG